MPFIAKVNSDWYGKRDYSAVKIAIEECNGVQRTHATLKIHTNIIDSQIGFDSIPTHPNFWENTQAVIVGIIRLISNHAEHYIASETRLQAKVLRFSKNEIIVKRRSHNDTPIIQRTAKQWHIWRYSHKTERRRLGKFLAQTVTKETTTEGKKNS